MCKYYKNNKSRCAQDAKFRQIDFAALTSMAAQGASSKDLGQMLLDQQTARDDFLTWTKKVDCYDVFDLPMTSDFSYPTLVAQAPQKNILEDPSAFTLKDICAQQIVFKKFRSATDVVSLSWVLEKAENSTVSPLLLVLKQTYDALPKSAQGGLTFWKLLADKLAAKTYENTKLPTDYITEFRLCNTPGEDAGIASSCFKAAAKLLDAADRPSKLLQYFLRGMTDCSNQEFKSACDVQLGFIESPMYEDWARNQVGGTMMVLETFANLLVQKYDGLLSSKAWVGTTSSVFAAGHLLSLPSRRPVLTTDPQPG
jgi:hypothetical protein